MRNAKKTILEVLACVTAVINIVYLIFLVLYGPTYIPPKHTPTLNLIAVCFAEILIVFAFISGIFSAAMIFVKKEGNLIKIFVLLAKTSIIVGVINDVIIASFNGINTFLEPLWFDPLLFAVSLVHLVYSVAGLFAIYML